MIRLTINDLFELNSSVIYNPDSFAYATKVVIDSRAVTKNSLFIAIKGNNFDGHDFVKQAVNSGASAIIINRTMLEKFDDINLTIITVDDTVKALGQVANIWRKKLNAKVISLTGSNGKTSTKEIISSLLEKKFNVVKTVSNNNNHIGVPLTILSADRKTDFIVLEHGTNHFKEIEYTAQIAQPDFGLITNIGNSHLEYLINKKGVFNEKRILLDEVIKSNGVIFINDDDKYLSKYVVNYRKRISFGFTNNAIINGKILGFSVDGKMKLKISTPKFSLEVNLPLYGLSNAKNILAAVAVCYKLGMAKNELINSINSLTQPKGRLEVINNADMLIINDTYNANPESMSAAFNLLSKINLFRNKIIVLGDMFELGSQAKVIHLSLTKQILKVKPKAVFTIGKNMKFMSAELKIKFKNIKHFSDRNKMKKFLSEYDFSESSVLVKGSRGMKMEEMVSSILEGKK